ncbi:hypothetical protein E1B28_003254 [Marasmius oreades]|uniref:Uncharacterized protein n=1 Tax=Marasmius oreades TaxID=181124 RepID=A0A9P7RLK4_9AGAR|nr:uncharacterized protein E1B28_003254 [Marasmius oreades]KAG7085710.1 hypothetical protein E1B28_003254 [Marasmius oreades]
MTATATVNASTAGPSMAVQQGTRRPRSHSMDAEAEAERMTRRQRLDDGFEDKMGKFQLLFEQYISGSGHPDHPNVHTRVNEDFFKQVKNSTIFRLQAFLLQVAGTIILNKTDPPIKIIFQDVTPYAVALENGGSPVMISVCNRIVHITFTPQITEMMRISLSSNSVMGDDERYM